MLTQMREWGAHALAWLQLSLSAIFAIFTFWLGSLRGDANLQHIALPLAGYALASALVLRALREPARGRVLYPLMSLLGLVVSGACFHWRLPHAERPMFAAMIALAAFVLEVSFAAISIFSPAFIGAICLFAVGCEASLLLRAGGDLSNVLVATALIAAASAFTAIAVSRFERLARRIVDDEVARRRALERSSALEQTAARAEQTTAELEEQHQRLVLAQREAETMMRRLVHEMKQPLASVLGLIELVADDLRALPSSEPMVRDLGAASEQGRRLLAMVDDLLSIARLEHGAVQPHRTPTPLRSLLESVASRQSPPAQVSLSVRCAPELTASLDRSLMERLLENLLAPAVLVSKPGGEIELSAEQEGAQLLLSVKRTGAPVPLDARATFFDKFGGPAGEDRSVALRLYLCRLIAEAHGGTIALVDDAKFAAAVAVRLPIE